MATPVVQLKLTTQAYSYHYQTIACNIPSLGRVFGLRLNMRSLQPCMQTSLIIYRTKNNDETDCQNLVDSTHKQILSRPITYHSYTLIDVYTNHLELTCCNLFLIYTYLYAYRFYTNLGRYKNGRHGFHDFHNKKQLLNTYQKQFGGRCKALLKHSQCLPSSYILSLVSRCQ